jgi:hypothetical protein
MRRAKQHSNSHLFDDTWFTKEHCSVSYLKIARKKEPNDISGTKEICLGLYYLTWVLPGQFIYYNGRRRCMPSAVAMSPCRHVWHLYRSIVIVSLFIIIDFIILVLRLSKFIDFITTVCVSVLLLEKRTAFPR